MTGDTHISSAGVHGRVAQAQPGRPWSLPLAGRCHLRWHLVQGQAPRPRHDDLGRRHQVGRRMGERPPQEPSRRQDDDVGQLLQHVLLGPALLRSGVHEPAEQGGTVREADHLAATAGTHPRSALISSFLSSSSPYPTSTLLAESQTTVGLCCHSIGSQRDLIVYVVHPRAANRSWLHQQRLRRRTVHIL